MRYKILVLGFFIILLILIAGCTSPQNGTSTEHKIPASGNTNLKPGSTTSMQSIVDCKSPPTDPIRFQKFFPNVPGWEWSDKLGYNYRPFNKSTMIYDYQWYNTVSATYWISGESNINRSKLIYVTFLDYGPCAGDYGLTGNFLWSGIYGNQSRVNFHGYPAVRIQSNISTIGDQHTAMRIGVTNRLFVLIEDDGVYKNSVSEADADIDKFANAIDFKGFAASV